jgi:excisionase family DNA binding protein
MMYSPLASTEIVLLTRDELRSIMKQVAMEAAEQALEKVSSTSDLVSHEEAATLLGVTKRTVTRLITEGQIIGRRIGSKWVIERGSLQCERPRKQLMHAPGHVYRKRTLSPKASTSPTP